MLTAADGVRADCAEAGTLGWREGRATKGRTVVGVVAGVGVPVPCKGSYMALELPVLPCGDALESEYVLSLVGSLELAVCHPEAARG